MAQNRLEVPPLDHPVQIAGPLYVGDIGKAIASGALVPDGFAGPRAYAGAPRKETATASAAINFVCFTVTLLSRYLITAEEMVSSLEL